MLGSEKNLPKKSHLFLGNVDRRFSNLSSFPSPNTISRHSCKYKFQNSSLTQLLNNLRFIGPLNGSKFGLLSSSRLIPPTKITSVWLFTQSFDRDIFSHSLNLLLSYASSSQGIDSPSDSASLSDIVYPRVYAIFMGSRADATPAPALRQVAEGSATPPAGNPSSRAGGRRRRIFRPPILPAANSRVFTLVIRA